MSEASRGLRIRWAMLATELKIQPGGLIDVLGIYDWRWQEEYPAEVTFGVAMSIDVGQVLPYMETYRMVMELRGPGGPLVRLAMMCVVPAGKAGATQTFQFKAVTIPAPGLHEIVFERDGEVLYTVLLPFVLKEGVEGRSR